MPRRASAHKEPSIPVPMEVAEEEPTTRFPFENEVVVRPIPSFFQDRVLSSARYAIPSVSDPADWSVRIAQEKEKAKALKKASKHMREVSLDNEPHPNAVDSSASVPPSNQSLILGRGTVIDYSAASGRMPELWTISYPTLQGDEVESSSTTTTTAAGCYTERITRNELVLAKAAADKIVHSSSSLLITSFPLGTIQKFMAAHVHVENTWQERIDVGMETAIQHSILWKLILVASCELEREFRIQKAFEETKKRLALELQQQEELNKDKYQQGDCPKYYTKHPTSYMGGHFSKELTMETLGGDYKNTTATSSVLLSTLSPPQLAQRVRMGISKAYDYYSRVYSFSDYDVSISDSLLVAGFEGRRRSARVSSTNTTTVKDETTTDPIQSFLPKEYESGGAVAFAFLHLLDLLPPGVPSTVDFTSLETYDQYRLREQASQEPLSVLEGQQEDDENMINPFFMPSSQAIMLHLGRKQKSMTPADIQTAICYAVDDSIPLFFSLSPPTMHQTEISSTVRVRLECTSDDSLKDLPEMEASSFSKCRFTLKTFEADTIITEMDAARIKEELELRKQRELEKKQAELDEIKREERLWRLKKQYETWRFKSIQTGCTIWPSWSSYVGDKLKEIHNQASLSEGGINSNGKDESVKYLMPDEVNQEKTNRSQEEIDAEIAANLALELNVVGETSVGVNEGQRRSRRAARESTSEAISFYGSSSSLAPQQLLETIHRLVFTVYPKHVTLFDLRKILNDGHGDIKGTELRRIRSALGKVIFRQGKVSRLMVTSDTDSICWNVLWGDENSTGEALVKLGPSYDVHDPQLETSFEVTNNTDMDSSNFDVESFIPQDENNHQDNATALQRENTNDGTMQAPLHDVERERREIKILETYIASLHRAELTLRYLLLKKYRSGNGLQSVSPEIIAAAADEKEGDIDASDTKEIEELDKEGKIEWISDPHHPLLGQILYRPNVGDVETSNPSPTWFKVLDYTPSIPLSSGNLEQPKSYSEPTEALRDTAFVERRIHFRAGPSYCSNRQASKRTIILTEAQVKAGIAAAQLETELTKLSSTNIAMKHPFDGLDGLNFMLSPLSPSDSETSTFIHVKMAGHDTFMSADRKLDYRVLLIVEENDDIYDEKSPDIFRPGNAFWASVSTDASIVTPLHLTTVYKIIPQEYHSSTPAYAACKAVIDYLKSNLKIVPFLKPVDPVALQIPTYFDVIKKPMDLSTVENNLVKGEYGRIPPNSTYSCPISKMLNGPFYSHIMRIFDNAMTFNPPGDCIHNDAAQLKRLASKKIETLTLKAEREAHPTVSGQAALKRGLYKEVDSDVDAYEYESDYEGDDNAGKKRKRRTKNESRCINTGRLNSKLEDNSCRPIEAPVNIPVSAGIGIFADLPIMSDARYFGLPAEWSCRLSKVSGETSKNPSEEEERKQLLLLHMQLDQQSLTRRSSRSHDAVADNLLIGTKNGNPSESNLNMEYYLANDDYISLEDVLDDKVARTRVHLESIRETLHDEYFARLYYKYFTNNRSSPISATTFHYGEGEIHGLGYGMYTDNSFPPFLGRIVPVGFSPSQQDFCDVKWEIRPPFILPALRWVLRGLIQSNHLSEIEPLYTALSDSNPPVNDGVLLINNAYYVSNSTRPYDLLDVKEIARRKKAENATIQEQSRPDVHLSDYEKARLERVERNKERLRLLGLA